MGASVKHDQGPEGQAGCEHETLNLYGTVPDSIVDGPGLRYSVFVQGCTHACPGCHNPESQPFEGGYTMTVSEIMSDIRANPLCRNITITGGEPFDQACACAALARMLKHEGYGVWAYTGYLFEDLSQSAREGVEDLLEHIDVLVDGPFVESLKSLELDWRGSSNQRVIDMARTREMGRVVEWHQPSFDLEVPPSW